MCFCNPTGGVGVSEVSEVSGGGREEQYTFNVRVLGWFPNGITAPGCSRRSAPTTAICWMSGGESCKKEQTRAFFHFDQGGRMLGLRGVGGVGWWRADCVCDVCLLMGARRIA